MSDVTPVTTQVEAVIVAAVELIAPKPIRRWRTLVFQTYMLVAVLALGILLISASMFNYFSFDLIVTSAVQTINVAWFASLMWWVSMIGYAPQIYILVAAIAVFLFVIGLRWEAVTALMTAASGASLAALIKIAIHRPRPGANLVNVLHQLDSYSFPSGHVLTYTVFFGFLFFLSYTLLNASFVRIVLLTILGSLVSLIGISRIYVGDHWASDVIGAYLLGSLWLVFSVYIYRFGKTRFFVTQSLAAEEPGSVASKLE
jgi:membrane-associated phospholipid phosphatase